MRVMLTSIFCKSGLFTHVLDLASKLQSSNGNVLLAILKRTNSPRMSRSISKRLSSITVIEYKNSNDLLIIANKYSADLIHAHSPLVFDHSLDVSLATSVPLVLTVHAVYPWERQFPLVLNHAKHIIAVGPAQIRCCMQHTMKTSLIQNGIDLTRFHPRSLKNLQVGPLYILWFGRTHGTFSAGAAALDQAITLLQREGKNIIASMVGIAQGVKLAMTNYGWVDDPVWFLQRNHLVFGHGRALREAMACGNVGYLLGHGYAGMLRTDWFAEKDAIVDAFPQYAFPLASVDMIKDDLNYIYCNRHLLPNLRREARLIAEKHFDLQQMVARVRKVYELCLQ